MDPDNSTLWSTQSFVVSSLQIDGGLLLIIPISDGAKESIHVLVG